MTRGKGWIPVPGTKSRVMLVGRAMVAKLRGTKGAPMRVTVHRFDGGLVADLGQAWQPGGAARMVYSWLRQANAAGRRS